ncbi:hypothetical protein HELRODRAFT_122760, partial [Helobdella robusta]|uniref:polynucleotide adenylyltransferase n=1 Tax=Helobdella robusta TaxID=6412 RepID=T1EGV6_HELRO
ERFQVLCFDQVDRLNRVMDATVPIHGRGNFPTLNVRLIDFVKVVRNKLVENDVHVKDVRLNGGVASYVLGNENNQAFNDYDVIFSVQLKDQTDLNKIKESVLGSLLDFFPKGVSKERMSLCSLNEGYVHKMVKIFNDTDKWSLISLSNVRAKNIELKFADSMRRQFEFSVDSFQILLDSLLTFSDVSKDSMKEHFFPTVTAESVYGHYELALYHLNNKLKDIDIRLLKKYMCSMFFIDFSNISDQKIKLENYLADHFTDEEYLKFDYLMTLYAVVDESTICLMGHERRQTLDLISQMAYHIRIEQEQ